MRILLFSDIHGDLRALHSLMDQEADLYVAAGDMVTWGRGLEKVGEVLKRRAGQVHILPGNHESEAAIAEFSTRFGLHPFHGKTIEANGYRLAGLGYSNPTPFDTPGEYTEEELARRLAPFALLKPLVLVCHCPPKGTRLDEVRSGTHAGSQSVRDFIDRHQPDYFFCGHIHEAEGITEMIGNTRGTNVGKRGFLLEL